MKLLVLAIRRHGRFAASGVRWAGTESGVSPDPCWSTAQSSQDYGAGEPDGPVFAPVEADVTMSATGEWYWRPGQPIKSLAALATIYDGSVGANGNLLLGFHPTYTGALPDHVRQLRHHLGPVLTPYPAPCHPPHAPYDPATLNDNADRC